MPTKRKPRCGSLQFWPRKRAIRAYSRVRHHPKLSEVKLTGFAGYKAGMTHITITDNRATSLTKGTEIALPVTIIECPPLKAASIRFYKKTDSGLQVSTEIFSKGDKDLGRKIKLSKKDSSAKLAEAEKKIDEFADVRIAAYTQPKLTCIGKKKPEIFELAIGGDIKQKLEYAKNILGKEIKIDDVFKEGEQVDICAVTKGRGLQGPVRRFGISLKSHKSEKKRRAPGNIGAWTGNRSWTVAFAGQTGYHNRKEYNKWILKISDKAADVNPKGGILHYGDIKNSYILLKGSVQGAAKRLVRLMPAESPRKNIPTEAPTIEHISTESKQGN
ncbi:MAG: 50S ribosomal protein L3 [bacterium]|nr:50S ribosomal protein L3 [bacterium]